MPISKPFQELLDRASVSGAAFPDRERIKAFLQKEGTADERDVWHRMTAFIPEEKMLEAPHVASLAESLGKGARVIQRGAASPGPGNSRSPAAYDFAAVAAQYGQPTAIIKILSEDEPGKLRMLVATPKGPKIVAVAPLAEKPKFYEKEFSALIRDGTRFSEGWGLDEFVTVAKYLKADFAAEHQHTFAKLRSGIPYQGKLAPPQIAAFAESIGMSEHVWNQAAIDATERDRQEQAQESLMETYELITKGATAGNVLRSRRGDIPCAAWHQEFFAKPIGERVAQVAKLVAMAPFTTTEFNARMQHIQSLIIRNLAPKADATTAARPATAPTETATAKDRRPLVFGGARRPAPFAGGTSTRFGGAFRGGRPSPAAGASDEAQLRADYQADPKARSEFPTFATYRAYRKHQPGARTQAADGKLAKFEAVGKKYLDAYAQRTFVPAAAEKAAKRAINAGAARISGDAPEPHVELPAATITSAADYEEAFKALPASERAEYGNARAFAAFQKANRAGAVNIAA